MEAEPPDMRYQALPGNEYNHLGLLYIIILSKVSQTRVFMSHFTSIKTQIKNRDALVKALADVGFARVEVHETGQPLYGFQGDVRPEKAEVIVRRKYLGAASNDIGFKQQKDGQFEAIISAYDRAYRYSRQWLNEWLSGTYGDIFT